VTEGPPATKRIAGWLSGFTVFVVVVMAAMLVVQAAVRPFVPPQAFEAAPSLATAFVVIGAYLWRPRPALLAFALYMLFNITLGRWFGPGLNFVDEMAVPGLFVIAGLRAVRDIGRWWWWWREGAVMLIVVVGIVSSLVNQVPVSIWLPSLVLMGKGIAFLYVVTWTDYSIPDLRPAMRIVLVLCLVLMGLSIIELVDPLRFQQALGLTYYYEPRGILPAVKSLFFHPVLFAWFTAFVALFAHAHFAETRNRWSLAIALVLSLGPFLAARRRAILALVAGIVAAFVRSWHLSRSLPATGRRWLPSAVGIAVISVIFLPGLVLLYQRTFDRYVPSIALPSGEVTPGGLGGMGENTQARVALYRGSISIGLDHFPIGVGLGRYGSWMSRTQYSPVYAEYGLDTVKGLRPRDPRNVTDTFWPQILGELGVLGVAAYAAFLASLGWLLWKAYTGAGEQLTRVFFLGTGMIFVQTLVESLASPMFHSPPRIYLVYLAVGTVAAIHWRRREPDRPGE
jgi:hypothetical protein